MSNAAQLREAFVAARAEYHGARNAFIAAMRERRGEHELAFTADRATRAFNISERAFRRYLGQELA